MRNGKIYAPPMSERPTDGKEYGLLPTPSTRDYHAQGATHNDKSRSSSLATVIQKKAGWPTPRSSDADRGGRGDLIAAVRNKPNSHFKMIPTPTANRRDGLQSHGVNVVSGSLNPVFVEWLMGYPIGWTDLNASGIALSLKSRS
jgi:hypothetical protein